MSLRILGGIAKGAPLAAPKSQDVRPTSVLLKRKFFDAHQSLSGARFYDLCAGSGAVALEALSREAAYVEMVELDAKALAVLKKNKANMLAKWDFPGEAKVVKADAVKWIEKHVPANEGKAYYFFDPPYDKIELYRNFLAAFQEKAASNCSLIVEFCRQKTASEEEFQGWLGAPDKIYRQGASFLYIYNFS